MNKKIKPYESKKTIFLHLRIDKNIDDLLNEICDKIGFQKSALARMLLNRSLKRLKEDGIKSNWDLEFTIKHD